MAVLGSGIGVFCAPCDCGGGADQVPTDLHIACGGCSHRGKIRDTNEDDMLCLPRAGLWLVADGMGGHRGGDVASAMIAAQAATMGVPVSAQDQRARLGDRLKRAHDAIRSHADQRGLDQIGATVAALTVFGSAFACVWAGDSRVYLWRDADLIRLTQDHSEVQAMIAAGLMSEEQARRWPRRNVITRAVGIGPHLRTEMVTGVTRPGDRFLICTDGLTEHLGDAELAAFMARPGRPQDIARSLMDEALRRGAHDNVTLLVLTCRPASNGGKADDAPDGVAVAGGVDDVTAP